MMSNALFHAITEGVLPDNESPKDIPFEVEYAPVSQAPDRSQLRSLRDSNLEWAVRLYAHKFAIDPTGAERIVDLLHEVRAFLGEDAGPNEMFVAMRDILAQRPTPQPDDLALLVTAHDDALSAERAGLLVA